MLPLFRKMLSLSRKNSDNKFLVFKNCRICVALMGYLLIGFLEVSLVLSFMIIYVTCLFAAYWGTLLLQEKN